MEITYVRIYKSLSTSVNLFEMCWRCKNASKIIKGLNTPHCNKNYWGIPTNKSIIMFHIITNKIIYPTSWEWNPFRSYARFHKSNNPGSLIFTVSDKTQWPSLQLFSFIEMKLFELFWINKNVLDVSDSNPWQPVLISNQNVAKLQTGSEKHKRLLSDYRPLSVIQIQRLS